MTATAKKWSESYRARLAVGYVAIVAVFAAAWAWSLFGPLTETVAEQQEENLRAVAHAGAIVLGETDRSAIEVARELVGDTGLRVTIIDENGVVLADNEEDPASMENHGDRPEIRSALSGNVGSDQRLSSTQDTERIYVAVPASFSGEPVALRVSASLDSVVDIAAQARRTGLLLLAVALVFATILVARLTALASEPIARLTASARTMAAGDLGSTIRRESGDLEVLSSALSNLRSQMQTRLDELEAESDNLQSVLDGLADAVFLLHDRKIRFANKKALELFSSARDGWIGTPFDDGVFPASIEAAIGRHVDGLDEASEECGPDPQGRFMRVTVLPLYPSGGVDRTLVSITDQTERVQVDRVRRDFVANASHELKTPVSGIHLLAESAADAAKSGEVEQALSFAKQISAESERLGRLVRDLLDLSRLEAAYDPVTITDLRGAVENAIVGHTAAAADADLELTFDDSGARGQEVLVRADSTDIAVALDNLLDNAIKYTESGGVTVSIGASDDHITLEVADTGIGIPASDTARVFERFYRVDKARSRDSGGTGLGLALVRHVVERAECSIEMSSEVGKGTTFTLTFPRVR